MLRDNVIFMVEAAERRGKWMEKGLGRGVDADMGWLLADPTICPALPWCQSLSITGMHTPDVEGSLICMTWRTKLSQFQARCNTSETTGLDPAS